MRSMNDTEILDWIQKRVAEIRVVVSSGETEIMWLNDDGIAFKSRSINLRDVVKKAERQLNEA